MADQAAPETINRRKALRNMSLVLGAASSVPALAGLSAEAVFAQGKSVHEHVAVKSAEGPTALKVFNSHQNHTVIALSELIIPQTSTPGARAAMVPQFIDLLLAERETQMQNEIAAGLRWSDQRSRELFGRDFADANPEQQIDLLTRISSPNSSEATLGQVFFNQIKNLTAFGYYTSKEGLEQELGYEGPQGIRAYEGSVPVGPR